MTSRTRQPGEPCAYCNKATHSVNHFVSPKTGRVFCSEAHWRARAQQDMEFLADWKRANQMDLDVEREVQENRMKEL